MSYDTSLGEILVSQLGSPRDPAAEWLGAGVVMLLLLAYLSLEFGLARLLVRIGGAITAKWRSRKDRP